MTRIPLLLLMVFAISCVSSGNPRQVRADRTDKSGAENQEKETIGDKANNSAGDSTSKIILDDNEEGGRDENPDLESESDQTTGGSGGVKGPNELKSSGGLSYLIDVPVDNGPAKAHGLLILLHGSGASNYRNFVKSMKGVAEQHDLIPVSVLAPNRSGWNEGDQNAAAEILNQLIQDDLFTKYNISKKKVLFSGQSSGGGFLSSHFVAKFGKDYQGGAFLQCGAAPPNNANFQADENMKKNFRLHFEITSGDPIWPASYARATKIYEAAGMQVSKDNSKRGGHCAFDQQQVILDHIKFILGGN